MVYRRRLDGSRYDHSILGDDSRDFGNEALHWLAILFMSICLLFFSCNLQIKDLKIATKLFFKPLHKKKKKTKQNKRIAILEGVVREKFVFNNTCGFLRMHLCS